MSKYLQKRPTYICHITSTYPLITGWPQFWRKKVKEFSNTFNLLFQTYLGDILPSYFNDGDFRQQFFHFLLEIKQNNIADFYKGLRIT